MNIVLVRGVLSSEPREKQLPSGSRLVSWEVTTDADGAVAPIDGRSGAPSLEHSSGDGIFGPGSAGATLAWQESQGLPATGELDQATFASMPTPTPTPRPVVVPTTTPVPRNCHPSYDRCLTPGIGDYDCAGGSGNGPNYTGRVRVTGWDEYGLDHDNDGIGCE